MNRDVREEIAVFSVTCVMTGGVSLGVMLSWCGMLFFAISENWLYSLVRLKDANFQCLSCELFKKDDKLGVERIGLLALCLS